MDRLWNRFKERKIRSICWLLALTCLIGLIGGYVFPKKIYDTYPVNAGEGKTDTVTSLSLSEKVVSYEMTTAVRPLRGIHVFLEKGDAEGNLLLSIMDADGKILSFQAYDLVSLADNDFVYLPIANSDACEGKLVLSFGFSGNAVGDYPKLAANSVETPDTVTSVSANRINLNTGELEASGSSESEALQGSLKTYYVYTHNIYPLAYDLRILFFLFLAAGAGSEVVYKIRKKENRPFQLSRITLLKYAVGVMAAAVLAAGLEAFIFHEGTLGQQREEVTIELAEIMAKMDGSEAGEPEMGGLQADGPEMGDSEAEDSEINASKEEGFRIQAAYGDSKRQLSEAERDILIVNQENARILADATGAPYADPTPASYVEIEREWYEQQIATDIWLTLPEHTYIGNLTVASDEVKEEAQYNIFCYVDGEWDKQAASGTLHKGVGVSQIQVDAYADQIRIVAACAEKIPAESITLTYGSGFAWNYFRMGMLFLVCLLAEYFIFVRRRSGITPEYIFGISALTLGIMWILLIGTTQVGFDEQTHAYNAYTTSFLSEVPVTEMSALMQNNEIPEFDNLRERSAVEEYADRASDYQNASKVAKNTRIISYDKRSYLPTSIMMALARGLGLPFVWMIMLGKFGNLLLYTGICYAAVKWAKQGKVLVAVLALLPNNLFSAVTFTYDSVVNSFLLLAVVLTINRMLLERSGEEKKITCIEMLFIAGAYICGSTPKPIYMVMACMILFFAGKHFEDKRSQILSKVSITVIIGLMLYVIFRPPVSASSNYEMIQNIAYAGDKRNVGTSVLGQLSYIMGNPIQYTKLLLSSMFQELYHYLLGGYQYFTLGYIGALPLAGTWIGAAVCVAAASVSPVGRLKNGRVNESIGKKYRILQMVMVFGVSAIIWTSMYVSYTPVGNETILGVQGRYFAPLFLPALSCLYNGKIQVPVKKGSFAKICIGIMAAMNIWCILTMGLPMNG